MIVRLFAPVHAARFGGLTPLLGKFPDRFVLENDPPFNHVSLRGRAFLGGGEGGGGGGPLGAHPAPPPADAPLLLAPLPLPRGAPMPVVSERRAPGDVETALVKATAGILREVAGGSLQVCVCVCEFCVYVCMCMCLCVYVFVCVFMYLSMCVCVCACRPTAGAAGGIVSIRLIWPPPHPRALPIFAAAAQAVELANMLRARMGTETLAAVREHHGGLLALLERHPGTFRVSRIPKNDCVALESGAWAASSGAGGAGASCGRAWRRWVVGRAQFDVCVCVWGGVHVQASAPRAPRRASGCSIPRRTWSPPPSRPSACTSGTLRLA
jgi:hypothetical protein